MENLTYEERKLALIAEITTAFDGVERGNGTTFYEGTALDNGGFPEKITVARAKDMESRWQDVPNETFSANYSAFTFLDDRGFYYYLPAVTIWHLHHRGKERPQYNENTFDSMMLKLCAGSEYEKHYPHWFEIASPEDEIALHYLSSFRMLNREQSKAIAHFLEFEAERLLKEEEEWQSIRVGKMREEHCTEEEIATFLNDSKDYSEAQQALDRYWGQFL